MPVNKDTPFENVIKDANRLKGTTVQGISSFINKNASQSDGNKLKFFEKVSELTNNQLLVKVMSALQKNENFCKTKNPELSEQVNNTIAQLNKRADETKSKKNSLNRKSYANLSSNRRAEVLDRNRKWKAADRKVRNAVNKELTNLKDNSVESFLENILDPSEEPVSKKRRLEGPAEKTAPSFENDVGAFIDILEKNPQDIGDFLKTPQGAEMVVKSGLEPSKLGPMCGLSEEETKALESNTNKVLAEERALLKNFGDKIGEIEIEESAASLDDDLMKAFEKPMGNSFKDISHNRETDNQVAGDVADKKPQAREEVREVMGKMSADNRIGSNKATFGAQYSGQPTKER